MWNLSLFLCKSYQSIEYFTSYVIACRPFVLLKRSLKLIDVFKFLPQTQFWRRSLAVLLPSPCGVCIQCYLYLLFCTCNYEQMTTTKMAINLYWSYVGSQTTSGVTWGGGAPGDTVQGVTPWWKSNIFAPLNFTQSAGETITWKVVSGSDYDD